MFQVNVEGFRHKSKFTAFGVQCWHYLKIIIQGEACFKKLNIIDSFMHFKCLIHHHNFLFQYFSIFFKQQEEQLIYFVMHEEIQIAPGVYITDFRKQKNIVGLSESKSELTNDVGLLLDQVQAIELKINQLIYTIEEIKKQDNWQQDKDFYEAVEDNWKCIIKSSTQMKEKVLWLFQLKYHPQTQKVEDLLKITRIQQRQEVAINEVKKIVQKYRQDLKEKGVSQEEQSEDQDKKQEKGGDQEPGVFV